MFIKIWFQSGNPLAGFQRVPRDQQGRESRTLRVTEAEAKGITSAVTWGADVLGWWTVEELPYGDYIQLLEGERFNEFHQFAGRVIEVPAGNPEAIPEWQWVEPEQISVTELSVDAAEALGRVKDNPHIHVELVP